MVKLMYEEEVKRLAVWQALQLMSERVKSKKIESKYPIAKNLIQMIKRAKTDEEILEIYERVYLKHCRLCKNRNHPNPFYHSIHCPIYAVKRSSFEHISDEDSLRELAKKLYDLRSS
jgi:hypothetical protein